MPGGLAAAPPDACSAPCWDVAQAWPAGRAPTSARSVANPSPTLATFPGYWRDWAGTPLDQAPLFYHDITPLAAETLEGIWGELRATNEALASALGLQEPPSRLQRIISAVMERYAAVVEDASTVLSVFQTNGAYHGFTHAVRCLVGWCIVWLRLAAALPMLPLATEAQTCRWLGCHAFLPNCTVDASPATV